MGLFDLFKMGKVIAGTVKAVRSQRNLGKELAALPMDSFVPTCLAHLNESAGNWQGRARAPLDSAEAIAHAKQLPDELVEFYRICDGFEGVHGDFPALIHPLQQLQIGAAHSPPLSALLASCWEENGNDSDRPGLLSVLPPDDLAALATHAADSYLKPSSVDLAVPLCPPIDCNFSAILLAEAHRVQGLEQAL